MKKIYNLLNKTKLLIDLANKFFFPQKNNLKNIPQNQINFELALQKAQKNLNKVKLILEECDAFNTLFECHFNLLEINQKNQTNKKIYDLCVEKHKELIKTSHVVKKVRYLLETLDLRLTEKIKILNSYNKQQIDKLTNDIKKDPNLIYLKNLNIKLNYELNLLDTLHPHMDLVKEFNNWQHSETFILKEQNQTHEKTPE